MSTVSRNFETFESQGETNSSAFENGSVNGETGESADGVLENEALSAVTVQFYERRGVLCEEAWTMCFELRLSSKLC